MADLARIREHMEVVGADGKHVGKVDRVEGNRIKLVKGDSGGGAHKGHHHFLKGNLVAAVEGNVVKLSKNADMAISGEEEASGSGTAMR